MKKSAGIHCLLVIITAGWLLHLTASISFAEPAQNGLAERIVSADLRQIKGPLNTMFKTCVGAGRANEGLRADWQRQLTRVHEQCGFNYIRMHGLFCDDMGVYHDRAGRPEYNWQYIDELFDFLLSIGMKPFVEIGFMPADLASGSQKIFWWRGNVTLPKDFNKWAELIQAFTRHVSDRYGEEEVKQWYFEVWNEPNLSGFFKGSQQDYFHLYDVTAKAIKSVSADYRVGGPATAGCGWISDFIDFCVTQSSPVDFVSTHTYGVEKGFLDEKGNAGTVLSKNPRSIYGEMIDTRNKIRGSKLPELELHFTEWSSSYTPADPFHDSYHSAAYILDKVKGAGNSVDSMSYWVFTDIFEEPGPRFTPFHGGFGLVNIQGINKPAFYAYQFMNRLGDTELQTVDTASWVCRDKRGGIQALIWDYSLEQPAPTESNQVHYKRDLPSHSKWNTTLKLSGVSAGQYTLSVYRVGYRANDAYSAYMDTGSPSQLSRAQIDYIKSMSDGKPERVSVIKVASDGTVHETFTLKDNDVCFITLTKQ
ncbi:glycoside hydrolase [Verrucomicrobia bacterium IMCC26134]|nr:glycoside hydrolase [Verrucomicrobia bacterium IMCC26134]